MANVAFGRDLVLGMAQESSYGEAWGSPTLVGVYIEPDPALKVSKEFLTEMHAHGYPMLRKDDVAQGVNGSSLSISGNLPKEGFSWLLLNLAGKVTTSAFTASYYKHIFDLIATTPKSLKLVLKQPIKPAGTSWEYRLLGCMIRTLEISGEVNRPTKFRIDFVGGDWSSETIASSVTIPVTTLGNPFWWFNDSNTSLAYDTTQVEWDSFTLRLESKLAEDVDDSYNWGSASRAQLERASTEQAFDVILTLKRKLVNDNLLVDYRDFEDITVAITHGPMTADNYGFKMLEDIGFKVSDYGEVRKGLGLIHEQVTLQGWNQSIAEPTLFTTVDKQSTPVTQ